MPVCVPLLFFVLASPKSLSKLAPVVHNVAYSCSPVSAFRPLFLTTCIRRAWPSDFHFQHTRLFPHFVAASATPAMVPVDAPDSHRIIHNGITIAGRRRMPYGGTTEARTSGGTWEYRDQGAWKPCSEETATFLNERYTLLRQTNNPSYSMQCGIRRKNSNDEAEWLDFNDMTLTRLHIILGPDGLPQWRNGKTRSIRLVHILVASENPVG